LPAGLVVTAVLAGLFTLARRQAEPGRLLVGDAGQLPSVAGLAASAVLALVVAGVVVWLIRRDTALTQRGLRPAPPPDATVGDRAANWAVIGLFLVCLLAGGAVWQAVTNRVTAFAVGEFRGSYPAHFSPAIRPDDVLRVTDVMGTQAEFVIASITGEEPLAPRAALPRLAARRAAEYDVYRVLGTQETQWHDRSALMQRFAAVERPAFEPAMPRLIEGADYIIPDGARVVIVTLLATPESYAGVEQLFERFVNDLGF
jgi:hypothetical protein